MTVSRSAKAAAVVRWCASWLKKQSGSPKILVKVTRNLGDSLHATPIIHHYRLTYPDAAIAFLTAENYANAHAYNPHITKGGLFRLPRGMTPQERLALWPLINNLKGIDIKIIPAIHPFGTVYKQNTWSYPNIADQYIHNAGITDLKPIGGRKLIVITTDEDRKWALNFLKRHGIFKDKFCVLEYNSYSGQPIWRGQDFKAMANRLRNKQIKCVSVCGPNENVIPGTVSAQGISWRQTVALLDLAPVMVGVGSGITMLAAAAQNVPFIIEAFVSLSITMKGCGYADSTVLKNRDPCIVAKYILHKVLKK